VLDKLERRPGETKPILSRKKMVRRFLNAMGREAPVRLDHARNWAEIQPILNRFMQAHVARFLYTGRISNMARPERRGFLAELARLFSESGSVVLTRMISAQNAFAWNYGFQFHGTWFWYQPTFESDLEKYSPGFCMLSKFIEEAAETPGIKIVDLGLGAEEYKDRVANQTRETLFVTLKSSPAQHFREIVRFNAAEIVRASPRVENSVRAVLQRGRRIKERAGQDGAGTTLSWLGKRLRDLLWLEGEVFFYEGRSSAVPSPSSLRLQPLGLNEMATATMQHVDDRFTLDYLLRSASRLREGDAEAYGLLDASGTFVHFAWATDFDGFFLSELNAKVDAPGLDCVMLFDCWSPAAERGHGYYAQAVELIAEQVRQKGKRPWIFSAARNAASVRGLEKAGFERRYSLVRQRMFGWQRIKGVTPRSEAAPGAEASAHV
jgi:hypothetical protein